MCYCPIGQSNSTGQPQNQGVEKQTLHHNGGGTIVTLQWDIHIVKHEKIGGYDCTVGAITVVDNASNIKNTNWYHKCYVLICRCGVLEWWWLWFLPYLAEQAFFSKPLFSSVFLITLSLFACSRKVRDQNVPNTPATPICSVFWWYVNSAKVWDICAIPRSILFSHRTHYSKRNNTVVFLHFHLIEANLMYNITKKSLDYWLCSLYYRKII